MSGIIEFYESLTYILRGVTYKDVIDIVIVAVLIYGIINLVKETRAVQLVKGIIFLILIFFISIFLELAMLNTILVYFFSYAFIAVLVVFQPEIRKALEQMGRNNVGKSLVHVVSAKDTVDEVAIKKRAINSLVDSYEYLKSLKMGAIVVFERDTKLGEIIETGTTVDAQISSKLLSNIFFNKSPLHDGAVVIRNGRVISAGCILPLTKNDMVSSTVGTRHRAGLGMSEESDAIVVILSEETGTFSVAENGILKRDYSKNNLRAYLNKVLIEDKEVGSTDIRKLPIFNRKKDSKDKKDEK